MTSRWMVCVFVFAVGCSEEQDMTGDGGSGGGGSGGSGAVGGVGGAGGMSGGGGLGGEVASDIDKARDATERYQVLQNALDDGYEPNAAVPCLAHNGWRYVNVGYFQTALVSGPDIEKPVNLVYEREPSGDMTLVAVEYLASGAGDTPSIFAQEMDGPFCIPDLPELYALHVWLWKDNPHGMFEHFNSTVPPDVCVVDDVDHGVRPPSPC